MIFLLSCSCLALQLLLQEHQLALEVFYMLGAMLVKERRDVGKGVAPVVRYEAILTVFLLL